MDELGLVDVWRLKNPMLKQYTWSRENVRVRLDFFLISDSLVQMIEETTIVDAFLDDHDMPLLKMQLTQNKRGRGSWKFNVSLLRNKDYVKKIEEIIENQKQQVYSSHILRWETLKMLIRSETISFSIIQNKQRHFNLEQVENQLKELNAMENQPLSDAQLRLKYALIQKKDQIMQEKIQGAILRSKVDWATAGNKPSRYFLGLEKTRYSRKTITRLNDSQGTICTHTDDLHNIFLDFYAKLYQQQDDFTDDQLEAFFEGLQGPKLTQHQADKMDETLALDELTKALFEMKNNKTPGPDGFPCEFYKHFWESLKINFEQMAHESLDGGMSQDMLRSITTLIAKKDRDPLFIDNWRPISLLNVDYKIIAKAFVNRLNKILPLIIDSDQKGFVKGRYIGENLIELMGLIEYADKQQLPAFFLSCDYYKAFDTISYRFFDRALQFFQFGDRYRKYMGNIYTNIEATVMNNGHFTNRFKINRGFRQGDPLSSVNFILVQQILTLKIKQNQDIAGIFNDNPEKKVGLFADDMWAVLYGTQNNLQSFLRQIDQFKITGLQFNYDKTLIMRIGSLRNANAVFYTIKPLNWVDPTSPHGITVLGIKLGNNQAIQSNYQEILSKLQHIINVWDKRSLSVMGKITLINTLMCSIMVYKALMTLTPLNEFYDKFKKSILSFLWGEKNPHRLRYTKLILSKWNGGLGLIDIKTKNDALKASWIPRILKANNQFYANIFYQNLPIHHPWIWECNITKETLSQLLENNIWNQIWCAWAGFNYNPPYNRETILLQVLWYNQEIRRHNQPWFSPELAGIGIIRIQDIYDKITDRFLTYHQACARFQTRFDILHYNAIIVSIPHEWKVMLQTYTPVEPTLIDKIHRKPKPAAFLYNLARNNFQDNDWCLSAWKRDFPAESYLLNLDYWNQALSQVHLISNQADYTFLQYRIVHRILTTNLLRSKWDPQVSRNCTFCTQTSETIVHLFCFCEKVKPLWKFVSKWLNKLLHFDVELNDMMIIFNNYKGPQRLFINSIILYTKHYIYSCKCRGCPIQIVKLVPKFIESQNIEKLVAIRTGQVTKHDRKWIVFNTWLKP